MEDVHIGVDVQARRAFACMAIDDGGDIVDSAWCSRASEVHEWVADLARHGARITVGIDAPSQPLSRPREWFWEGKRRAWRSRRAGEKGIGRHAEVVISAHRIANPQWTPFREGAPKWMVLGFELFATLHEFRPLEVFPTASYRMLEGNKELRVSFHFADFAMGPKDMLDACIGAVTVREYDAGRGEKVGNGDGLGSIVLPRKLTKNRIEEVLEWPDS